MTCAEGADAAEGALRCMAALLSCKSAQRQGWGPRVPATSCHQTATHQEPYAVVQISQGQHFAACKPQAYIITRAGGGQRPGSSSVNRGATRGAGRARRMQGGATPQAAAT
jgi:hypothetical protein